MDDSCCEKKPSELLNLTHIINQFRPLLSMETPQGLKIHNTGILSLC